MGTRKAAVPMFCAPEGSLILDLHVWKRARICWFSDADFHPAVESPVFIASLVDRFGFA